MIYRVWIKPGTMGILVEPFIKRKSLNRKVGWRVEKIWFWGPLKSYQPGFTPASRRWIFEKTLIRLIMRIEPGTAVIPALPLAKKMSCEGRKTNKKAFPQNFFHTFIVPKCLSSQITKRNFYGPKIKIYLPHLLICLVYQSRGAYRNNFTHAYLNSPDFQALLLAGMCEHFMYHFLV